MSLHFEFSPEQHLFRYFTVLLRQISISALFLTFSVYNFLNYSSSPLLSNFMRNQGKKCNHFKATRDTHSKCRIVGLAQNKPRFIYNNWPEKFWTRQRQMAKKQEKYKGERRESSTSLMTFCLGPQHTLQLPAGVQAVDGPPGLPESRERTRFRRF